MIIVISQKIHNSLSFRKIFLRALVCAKENLSGIRFCFFAVRKTNRIPHKFAFLQTRAKKRILRNDGVFQIFGRQ